MMGIGSNSRGTYIGGWLVTKGWCSGGLKGSRGHGANY